MEKIPQSELERICDESPVSSDDYQRAKDQILRIQLDTNNIQTVELINEIRGESQSANRHSWFAIGVAVFGLILSTCLQINSNNLTRQALEQSSDAVLGVSLDASKILPNEDDEMRIAMGLIPVRDSMLYLRLANRSPAKVEDVDLRMTLWQLYVDEKTRHLNTCPIGYVDHHHNPHYGFSNLQTTNVFNSKITLKQNEEYPFDLNLANLNELKLTPSDAQILLKIDVSFVKSVSQTNHSYTKLLILNSYGGDVLDPQIASALALGVGDKKEEVLDDGVRIPSLVYPFQEEEFLSYFNRLTPDLQLPLARCQEFLLSKTSRTIGY